MSAAEILKKLKSLGSESYANTMKKHGAAEPVYGVKIEELKKIQKQVKTDQELAVELYDSGVYDAMYLAGGASDRIQPIGINVTRLLRIQNGFHQFSTFHS